jgi:hypothetical protein
LELTVCSVILVDESEKFSTRGFGAEIARSRIASA